MNLLNLGVYDCVCVSVCENRQWALKVECGGEETGWESNSTGSLINIVITLTPEGFNRLHWVREYLSDDISI